MTDLGGFLLQTLTASGVAVLLLILKALFRDKLPPSWQFAVWGVLGIILLLPAGLGGRYVIFHWQLVVELVKGTLGDFTVTRVLFPFPVLTAYPRTATQWLFTGYVLGVMVYLARYLTAYIRLRRVLRSGEQPNGETLARIQCVLKGEKVRWCRVIQVPGLPSAFIFGILRPVLAIPAGEALDDKVILHETLHMKYWDTLWSAVIALLKCIHWCNPLLRYCADRALNDMEARCDQHVLERLEGEERKAYGRILLSMANERFAKTPGSTTINNGGKNIRRRIEAIARFKRYPAGMGLVSLCVILILASWLMVGTPASAVVESGAPIQVSLALARSVPCTTPAGAFDAYGKAVLDSNGVYRAMCATESMQADLLAEIEEKQGQGIYPFWECGLKDRPVSEPGYGYYIYNLKRAGENAYEGLLVIQMALFQEGEAWRQELAVQNLRVEWEKGRWVAIPMEKFRYLQVNAQSLGYGCEELPGVATYSGQAGQLRLEVKHQTVRMIDNMAVPDSGEDIYGAGAAIRAPHPNGQFSGTGYSKRCILTHLGTQAQRDGMTKVGFSFEPIYTGQDGSDGLNSAAVGVPWDSVSNGWVRNSISTEPGWGPVIGMGAGGGTNPGDWELDFPAYYVGNLYVNGELYAQLELHPDGGGGNGA